MNGEVDLRREGAEKVEGLTLELRRTLDEAGEGVSDGGPRATMVFIEHSSGGKSRSRHSSHSPSRLVQASAVGG